MNRKTHYSRREFLKASVVATGLAALGPRAYGRVVGANERVHFGVIGTGVMGSGHVRGLKRQQEKLTSTFCKPATCTASGPRKLLR